MALIHRENVVVPWVSDPTTMLVEWSSAGMTYGMEDAGAEVVATVDDAALRMLSFVSEIAPAIDSLNEEKELRRLSNGERVAASFVVSECGAVKETSHIRKTRAVNDPERRSAIRRRTCTGFSRICSSHPKKRVRRL